VIALILSVLFEGLQITANIIAGALLVTAGNVIILRRERNAAPVAAEAAERIHPQLQVEKPLCR
jgi:drug/metabolite transporter (DMT)-like permease